MDGLEGTRKTPLFATHLAYGGRLIEFGGWAMPVQYAGIIEEHRAVRQAAGLFDVSHMGEFDVRGRQALDLVQKAVTNDVSGMVDGQIVYSPMCYPSGGVVDDLLVYRLAPDHYFLVVNASNVDKDFSWLSGLAGEFDGLELVDRSADFAELALQGPRSLDILRELTAFDPGTLRYYHFRDGVEVAGKRCLVSRTGYTGEDGFEVYCQPGDAVYLWEAMMAAGKKHGLVPAGLGARDTLRFEAAMPLYGHELSAEITPLEAGLGRFVSFTKGDFVGREALLKQKEAGVPRKLVGFEMTERGIPRAGYPLVVDGEERGFVTTGSYSPTLEVNIGLGLLPAELATAGRQIAVRIRGKDCGAVTVKTPFYKRQKREG